MRGHNSTASDLVVAYAWKVDSTKAIRVLVVHKDVDETGPTHVRVSLDGAADLTAGDATVAWLRAPHVSSTYGVTWGSSMGNISFDSTLDGRPDGLFVPERIVPSAMPSVGSQTFTYEFKVFPCSAALLEVAACRGGC